MIESTRQLIEQEFNIRTTSYKNRLVSQVQITSTQIMRANSRRIAFNFYNLSGGTVYLLNDSQVSSSNGFICTASGGGKGFLWSEDWDIVTDAWYALGSIVSNILLLEIELTP